MITIPEKTAFLKKMGILKLDKDYSDEGINIAFERYIRHKKNKLKKILDIYNPKGKAHMQVLYLLDLRIQSKYWSLHSKKEFLALLFK